MKKWLLCLLSLFLALSLAACNTPAQTESETESESAAVSETESESESETETESEAEKEREPVDVYEAFEQRVLEYGEGYTLPYRIYVPDDYSEEKDYPVLLFLHGAGERGDDNTAQLIHVIPAFFEDPKSPVYDAIVICPQCPEGMQWVDTPWAEGSYDMSYIPMSVPMQGVMELLDLVQNEYSTDMDRFYAMGISMGGFGTWDICMRNPDLFAAAAPICGGGDPTEADALVDLPIYTVHGDADGSVPVAGTREMVAAIRDAGGEKIHYEEMPGYGHNVWTYASTEAEVDGKPLVEWLFEQVYGN